MQGAEGWESLPSAMYAGVKPSLFYPEERSNTFLGKPGIYLATECHIPGGHDLSRHSFLALKQKKNHFPKSCVVREIESN
jgi:hypothetical protein